MKHELSKVGHTQAASYIAEKKKTEKEKQEQEQEQEQQQEEQEEHEQEQEQEQAYQRRHDDIEVPKVHVFAVPEFRCEHINEKLKKEKD